MSIIEKEIAEAIQKADKIVITSHRSPDGDSIGSSVGLFNYLVKIGKQVQICHPDEAPKFLQWVIPANSIISYDLEEDEVKRCMENADLIFSLDYNDPKRLGEEMGNVLIETKARKVMIDHHLFPKDFAEISLSKPEVCSTAQIVYSVLNEIDKNNLDEEICTPLYLGIMTDTGSFRFPSVTAETHAILSEMLSLGVNHSKIHESVFDNVPLRRIQLRGFVMSEKLEFVKEYGIAIISLTNEELLRFDYEKGDTEGLVNVALAIDGVVAAVFLSEKDGAVKISFRSRPQVAVNTLAMENFDGGGHQNAAGGIFHGGMSDALSKLQGVLPNYFDKIG